MNSFHSPPEPPDEGSPLPLLYSKVFSLTLIIHNNGFAASLHARANAAPIIIVRRLLPIRCISRSAWRVPRKWREAHPDYWKRYRQDHPQQMDPHLLRHTCALTVLQATKDLRKVSLWLGHAHMQTTEIYTRVDPSVKLEALESVVPPDCAPGASKLPTS